MNPVSGTTETKPQVGDLRIVVKPGAKDWGWDWWVYIYENGDGSFIDPEGWAVAYVPNRMGKLAYGTCSTEEKALTKARKIAAKICEAQMKKADRERYVAENTHIETVTCGGL